jgi:hypothetical protein
LRSRCSARFSYTPALTAKRRSAGRAASSRSVIRRLYESDERGIVDEELIDDVGYAMLARCESIVAVTEASMGRARCMGCRAIIEHDARPETALACASCGWSATWREYHESYRRKQLHGGAATPAFRTFAARWPEARTPRDKLLAIDALVHACHVSVRTDAPDGVASRPAAVNLIEGTMTEVLRFLDGLAYGDASTPGLAESREQFRSTMREGWAYWRSRGKSRALDS